MIIRLLRPVLFILLFAVGCFAQVITTDVSPDFSFGATNQNLDGRIVGFALDPNNNSNVYAAGEWSGVWKSTDGAHTWQLSSSGLRNGITQEGAYPNLAIDATNSQRLLFASTSVDGRGFTCEGCQFGGLWVSTNAAASWQHVNLCSTNKQPDNISSVVFSSGSPFVATNCGIWTTTDPALQTGWRTLTLPSGIPPGGTVMAPGSFGQTLFACLGGGSRVYRSLNLGQSWDGGVSLVGTCTGLALVRLPNETQPSTSVAIHFTPAAVTKSGPGSNPLEVTVVNSSTGSTQNLGFANVAQGGSGRSGVWTATRPAAAAGPGISYDVFAADNFYFYRYTGNNQWTAHFNTHVDTWWMEFPSSYNGSSSCPALAANDGGIFTNNTNSCAFNGWVGASSGLNVTFGNHISGLSPSPTDSVAKACATSHGGQPCPTLFFSTTDDDTFIRQEPTYSWTNFPDGLGDAGVVWIDPLLPNLALAVRNGNYNLFAVPSGQTITTSTSFYQTISNGSDFASLISPPTPEYVKEILTTPGTINLTNGDFLAIQSQFSTNFNNCQSNKSCAGDVIVRNVSAALGQKTAQASWFDISPEAHFGPGQIGGIYPAGGHSTTVYVLTSNAPGVNYAGTSFQPGQVYSALSQVIGEAINSWTPANGSGANSLVRAYNLFVNPYNASELWAIDLGSNPSAIKVSRNGGQSWTAVQLLKDIATNYGEFDFNCSGQGWANAPSQYGDKFVFGNECSMTQMVFTGGFPQVRFAILYPGGVAFSGDGGNTWQALNATNAGAAQQPIQLPQSAFWDPTVNGYGNSSLYVSLEGRGVKRIDAPFATLGSGIQATPTFGAQSVSQLLVLGSDGKLWSEQAPFGNVPPKREQIDGNVAASQWVDSGHILVLGQDGNLWLEEAPFGSKIPPQRQQVDGNVLRFQVLDVNDIVVLGKNGALWLEQAPFGKVPPKRQEIDANVGSFQATNASSVAVLGTNGNLWLEQAPFGTVPPKRQQVDGSVASFAVIDANDILVLGRNSNLWLEQGPFGTVPPKRQQVDGNARNFQALSLNQIVVLATNGNLWLEQAPFGTTIPPQRQQIDANVTSFQAIDANNIFVLGSNGNLWFEQTPFGKLPPPRRQVDANVQHPSAGY